MEIESIDPHRVPCYIDVRVIDSSIRSLGSPRLVNEVNDVSTDE